MGIIRMVYGDNKDRSITFGLVCADRPNKRQAINNHHNDLNNSGALLPIWDNYNPCMDK